MKDDQQNYWQPQDEAEAPHKVERSTSEPPRVENIAGEDSDKVSARTPEPSPPRRSVSVPEEVSWEASDAVEHSRGPLWFIAVSIVTLALVGAMMLFRQWTFAALVLVMGVAVIVMARRPPRIVKYALNDAGLNIDGRMYYYSAFRAFGIIRDEEFFAIKLIPAKRFSPEVIVYFAEKDGETIVDILGSHLPMEDMKLDLADRIIRKIRL